MSSHPPFNIFQCSSADLPSEARITLGWHNLSTFCSVPPQSKQRHLLAGDCSHTMPSVHAQSNGVNVRNTWPSGATPSFRKAIESQDHFCLECTSPTKLRWCQKNPVPDTTQQIFGLQRSYVRIVMLHVCSGNLINWSNSKTQYATTSMATHND